MNVYTKGLLQKYMATLKNKKERLDVVKDHQNKSSLEDSLDRYNQD